MSHSQFVSRLLEDISTSPTPYHAVATATSILADSGFTVLEAGAGQQTKSGHYLKRNGGYLLAWVQPEPLDDRDHPGFCVVGAHTDSPNLRIKSKADLKSAGWSQLAIAVYGGALTNSWLDRDLGLAGRVVVAPKGGAGIVSLDFMDPRPILRVPQLAIHLDREIGDKGLKLDPQAHLNAVWSTGEESFTAYLADRVEVDPSEIVDFDVMAYDTQAPALVGKNSDMIASARIDNLMSTFCGAYALTTLDAVPKGRIPVLVLYDHEEVGSLSATGADGMVLANDLEMISHGLGMDRASHVRSLSLSVAVSADGAHATHPNYADRHDPNHQIAINGGLVIKQNVNQRYATDPETAAWLRSVCSVAGVPVQTYVHRNDIPCGSTIGPVTAARLGIPTVDCGVSQLAMHSIRELAGVDDVGHLVTVLAACWSS